MKKRPTKRPAAKRPTSRATRKPTAAKRATKPVTTLTTINVPALGAIWHGQGGQFAGIAKGRAGRPDHLLVFAVIAGTQDQAGVIAAAKAYTADGHNDFDAATCAEAALCFATAREHFEKKWYWTKEQHADDPGYGWIQSFSNGGQGWGRPGLRGCVFAVRRLPIR